MNRSIVIISGLDPSGGAGFIADTRVAAERGLRPVGVVTALTEQDTCGARAVEPVSAEMLADQLRALLSDIEVHAVKIGMLGSEAIAEAVASALQLTSAPVVWDPVLRPTRGGAALYLGDPQRARALLDPHLTLMTPNAAEAEVLWGESVRTLEEMRAAAAGLCGTGQAVLVTGGDLGDGDAVDFLAADGVVNELRGERVRGDQPVHGTGCLLSTAIACELARGATLAAAARAAKALVAERLRAPVRVGRGSPSVV